MNVRGNWQGRSIAQRRLSRGTRPATCQGATCRGRKEVVGLGVGGAGRIGCSHQIWPPSHARICRTYPVWVQESWTSAGIVTQSDRPSDRPQHAQRTEQAPALLDVAADAVAHGPLQRLARQRAVQRMAKVLACRGHGDWAAGNWSSPGMQLTRQQSMRSMYAVHGACRLAHGLCAPVTGVSPPYLEGLHGGEAGRVSRGHALQRVDVPCLRLRARDAAAACLSCGPPERPLHDACCPGGAGSPAWLPHLLLSYWPWYVSSRLEPNT